MQITLKRTNHQFRSFFVLPKIVKLGKNAESTTSILRTYFAILAFADITHVGDNNLASPHDLLLTLFVLVQILATLVDLGPARWQVSSWNMLAHGNTTLVVGLFAFRMWYFAYSSSLVNNRSKAKTT